MQGPLYVEESEVDSNDGVTITFKPWRNPFVEDVVPLQGEVTGKDDVKGGRFQPLPDSDSSVSSAPIGPPPGLTKLSDLERPRNDVGAATVYKRLGDKNKSRNTLRPCLICLRNWIIATSLNELGTTTTMDEWEIEYQSWLSKYSLGFDSGLPFIFRGPRGLEDLAYHLCSRFVTSRPRTDEVFCHDIVCIKNAWAKPPVDRNFFNLTPAHYATNAHPWINRLAKGTKAGVNLEAWEALCKNSRILFALFSSHDMRMPSVPAELVHPAKAIPVPIAAPPVPPPLPPPEPDPESSEPTLWTTLGTATNPPVITAVAAGDPSSSSSSGSRSSSGSSTLSTLTDPTGVSASLYSTTTVSLAIAYDPMAVIVRAMRRHFGLRHRVVALNRGGHVVQSAPRAPRVYILSPRGPPRRGAFLWNLRYHLRRAVVRARLMRDFAKECNHNIVAWRGLGLECSRRSAWGSDSNVDFREHVLKPSIRWSKGPARVSGILGSLRDSALAADRLRVNMDYHAKVVPRFISDVLGRAFPWAHEYSYRAKPEYIESLVGRLVDIRRKTLKRVLLKLWRKEMVVKKMFYRQDAPLFYYAILLKLVLIAFIGFVWVATKVHLPHLTIHADVRYDYILYPSIMLIIALFDADKVSLLPRHVSYLGVSSAFPTTQYQSTDFVNLWGQRTSHFYGSGYSAIGRVVVRKRYLDTLGMRLGSVAVTATFHQYCLQQLIEEHGDFLTAMGVKRRLIEQHVLFVSSLYFKQSLELQQAIASSATSNLTIQRLPDQRFREGVFSMLYKWFYPPAAGPGTLANWQQIR